MRILKWIKRRFAQMEDHADRVAHVPAAEAYCGVDIIHNACGETVEQCTCEDPPLVSVGA